MMSKEQSKFIKKYKFKKFLILLIQFVIIVSFILLWQILSSKRIINPFIFSSPLKIFYTLIDLIKNNTLWINLLTTLKEIVIAFTLGFGISFVLALFLYESNTFYRVIDPFLNVLNSLPKVCLGPILIIWFGANTSSIIIF